MKLTNSVFIEFVGEFSVAGSAAVKKSTISIAPISYMSYSVEVSDAIYCFALMLSRLLKSLRLSMSNTETTESAKTRMSPPEKSMNDAVLKFSCATHSYSLSYSSSDSESKSQLSSIVFFRSSSSVLILMNRFERYSPSSYNCSRCMRISALLYGGGIIAELIEVLIPPAFTEFDLLCSKTSSIVNLLRNR